jgi:hypothetical protein
MTRRIPTTTAAPIAIPTIAGAASAFDPEPSAVGRGESEVGVREEGAELVMRDREGVEIGGERAELAM